MDIMRTNDKPSKRNVLSIIRRAKSEINIICKLLIVKEVNVEKNKRFSKGYIAWSFTVVALEQ